MKTIIYMNERIRMKTPDGPVINVSQDKNVVATNEAKLFVGRKCVGRVVYDPQNNPSSTHEVKAWVEFFGDVRI